MATGNTKRIRRHPDTTRKLILDAAEEVMINEGYAAVSSRRIAQEIGLNAATIHYYYPTTDDLFIALHQRMTEQQLANIEAVLKSSNPLKKLWKYQSDWTKSALSLEFCALANHRKSIQGVVAEVTDKARASQAAALQRSMGDTASQAGEIPAVALATILVAIARLLANEERVGITCGHDEVRGLVEKLLGLAAFRKTPRR